MIYWLDSNIFIESKNRAYAFDLAPGFWDWLMEITDAGIARCPKMVFEEVGRGRDQVSNWIKMMKRRNLFATANSSVQQYQQKISAYVVASYPRSKADQFLRCADPWIISHAGSTNGVVVTHESPMRDHKVQIPNVCRDFGIRCEDLYSLGRKHGLRLVLAPRK